MKTSGNIDGPKAVIAGIVAMLFISLGLAAAGAAFVVAGWVPCGMVTWLARGISGIAALAGALLCGRKAKKASLPLCLASCGGYLLVVFILRGLIFQSVSGQAWVIPLCALLGCVAGALLSSGKRRRY